MTGPEPETERSLLAELAADPDVNLQEIAPGVYWGGDDDPGQVATGHEHVRPERPDDWPETSKRTPDMVMFDLLAEMAKEPGSGMTEIAPGVWHSVDLTETESTSCPFCRQKRWQEEGHGWISGPCEPPVDPRGVWLDTGSGPGYVRP